MAKTASAWRRPAAASLGGECAGLTHRLAPPGRCGSGGPAVRGAFNVQRPTLNAQLSTKGPSWSKARQGSVRWATCGVMTRRDFFGRFGLGLGGAALAGLFNAAPRLAGASSPLASPYQGLPDFPNFAPRARRVIYLFMSGGPSQMDLFDYKPALNRMNGQELPPSVRKGQR